VTRERWIDGGFLVVAAVLALVLAGPFRDLAMVVAQPVVLGAALLFAGHCATRFETDNPVRRPWQLLGLGLLSWLVGELAEALYLVATGGVDPFPSLADLFFVLAYPAIVASFLLFLRAYRAAGLSVEKDGATLPLIVITAVVGYVVLAPIVRSEAPFVERFVSAAYAALDLVALVPLLLLLRLTWRLRGGSVWKVWAGVLFGFLLAFLGDVSFAYFLTRAEAGIGPLSDDLDFLANLMYLLSYLVIARGTLHQRELLRA
jgi:hypothetical protein